MACTVFISVISLLDIAICPLLDSTRGKRVLVPSAHRHGTILPSGKPVRYGERAFCFAACTAGSPVEGHGNQNRKSEAYFLLSKDALAAQWLTRSPAPASTSAFGSRSS